MQTILGAGGTIGSFLARDVTKYDNKIRLVARSPLKVNELDELFKADLLNADDVMKAVEGSDVVYLTVGLPYNINTWRKQWPVVMKNVIEACLRHKAKLVFFDNIYMYTPSSVPHMKEDAATEPVSEKGKVRKQIADMLFDAINNRGLQALIARSADFYGPDAKNGLLNISVIENFKKGKQAFWLSDDTKIHSFTYTPDAAKATALLGNTPDAYGQVWHLPTSSEKFTGKEFVELVAKEMNVKPKYYILKKWMIGLIGIFSPMVKELGEMQYQNDQDYFFDSSKFEQRFGIKPTSYREGIMRSVFSFLILSKINRLNRLD